MDILNYKNFYLLGIGGIGMSAIASYLKFSGKNVSGYDKTSTSITKKLEQQGVYIHYEDDIKMIPKTIAANKNDSLIIYTPAIPNDSQCMNFFMEKDYSLIKRAKALAEITRDKFTIAVGGTHGKTTTSAMICHILKHSGIDCCAFLGGISANYKSNFIPPDHKKTDVFIVEADEYDKSFLELSPNVLIITSTDADHLDIYQTHENVIDNYQEFAFRLKKCGTLILREGLTISAPEYAGKVYYFGFSAQAYFSARNLKLRKDQFYFDMVSKTEKITDIQLLLPGEHNILNSLAAFAATRLLLKQVDDFKKAMATFKGVKRRFEYIIKTNKQIFIDDYAHHPTELTATISTLRRLYADKKITAIFQPHLYSRTRDFYKGFAKSLSVLDKVLLLDIYPAREEPIQGVTSALILNLLTCPVKILLTKEELLNIIKKEATEVLVTFGAGDIDLLVDKIENQLTN